MHFTVVLLLFLNKTQTHTREGELLMIVQLDCRAVKVKGQGQVILKSTSVS